MIDIRLDKRSFVPFYRQIIDTILAAVAAGSISPGEKLPTIRDLAVSLQINPNTVAKAYSQLQLLGVLDTQQGSGVFVGPLTPRPLSDEEKRRVLEDLSRDFVARAQLLNISLDDLIDSLVRMRKPADESRSLSSQPNGGSDHV